jgi:F-type H+-transporting ATPase subunit a
MDLTTQRPNFLQSMTLRLLMTGFAWLATSAVYANASDAAHADEAESIDVGASIIHHISDAYEIHFFGDVNVPLPIIIYAPDHGLDVFLSSEAVGDHAHQGASGLWYTLHHGGLSVTTDEPLGQHDAHAHDAHDTHGTHEVHGHAAEAELVYYDLSITKSVFGMLLMMFMMVLVFSSVGRSYKKRKGQAPKGLQNALEPIILFVRDEIAVPSIGKQADRYLPFLLTVFFFIFMSNLLGLIPFLGGFNITGTLGITMVLAIAVFLITSFSGNRHYWSHILWPSGVPLPIKFILVPIEIVGVLLKPTVLMIRLTANISAGHIIILAFTSLIFLLGDSGNNIPVGLGTGVFSTLFMIFMYLIEFLVAFLQAYVFTLLAALYFGDATQEAHH